MNERLLFWTISIIWRFSKRWVLHLGHPPRNEVLIQKNGKVDRLLVLGTVVFVIFVLRWRNMTRFCRGLKLWLLWQSCTKLYFVAFSTGSLIVLKTHCEQHISPLAFSLPFITKVSRVTRYETFSRVVNGPPQHWLWKNCINSAL